MKRVKSYPSLLAWRTARRLSQREAAKILGVSQPVYAQVELGRVRPRAPRGKAMSLKTGVAFEVVMGVA